MNLANKRVLVVEDDMLFALDTVDELRNAGCSEVRPVSRLETAMTLAQAQGFDAAVLDVFLDGAYVWELAGTLSAQSVPFIFLTGFSHAVEFPAAFASVPRLEKPVSPGVVSQTLASLFLPA
ncbi:MAG: response regulator [Rhodomicrobium sp.]